MMQEEKRISNKRFGIKKNKKRRKKKEKEETGKEKSKGLIKEKSKI